MHADPRGCLVFELGSLVFCATTTARLIIDYITDSNLTEVRIQRRKWPTCTLPSSPNPHIGAVEPSGPRSHWRSRWSSAVRQTRGPKIGRNGEDSAETAVVWKPTFQRNGMEAQAKTSLGKLRFPAKDILRPSFGKIRFS